VPDILPLVNIMTINALTCKMKVKDSCYFAIQNLTCV